MPLSPSKTHDVHEFKPLLAEIEDSPANPLVRVSFFLTLTTVLFFAVWAVVGEVDVVVTAPGKVIPAGHAKVIQPLEAGTISRILVKEGDKVRKGQPLIEIDPSLTTDELETSRTNYRHTRLEIERIESALSGSSFNGGAGSSGDIISAQQRLYESSRSSLEKQLQSKSEELERAKEEYKQTEVELAKNKSLLAQAKEKKERLAPVIDLIPRDDWDKNESDITTYDSNIDQQQHKLLELTHQQVQLNADIARINTDFQITHLQDLSEKQKAATELDGRVRELSFKRRKHTLISPVDGSVDMVYVHTVGGVVAAGEQLLSIVPSDQHLLIQSSVSNHDIGFIAKGMDVQLKVDTFEFQKYGMYEGKVQLISKDSHDSESKQQSAGAREQTEKKLEQVFEVYIQPTTEHIMVEGKEQSLNAGMTLTAEIKTGKRRIIEFFIYPLIKYWHDGITVR